MVDIFNFIIVLASSIVAVVVGIYLIWGAFKSLENDGGGVMVFIISFPIALMMLGMGMMVFVWLLSEVPNNVLIGGGVLIVVVGLAYLFMYTKLNFVKVLTSTKSILGQSIKILAKTLLGLALVVGIGWLAVEALGSFWNTTDVISFVAVLLFIFITLYFSKFKFTFKRKVTVPATPPKKPTLSPLEKKANQLWKNVALENDSEEFWAQYESLIKQVKKGGR